MQFIENMLQKAKDNPRHLVLPEGTEPRTIQAARIVADEKLAASVTLVGVKKEIEQAAAAVGTSLKGIQLENPADSPGARSTWRSSWNCASTRGSPASRPKRP